MCEALDQRDVMRPMPIGHHALIYSKGKAWYAQQWGLGGVMFWELSGDRNAALLGTLDLWLRQRAALRASTGTVSLQAPSRVDLAIAGTPSRAGRSYLTLFNLTGTFPGIALQGSLLPLNYDFLIEASASSPGSALLPGTFGLLDAQGNAAAAIDFTQAPVLLGLSVHACTWRLVVGAGNGEPTNPIEIRFTP